jgi:hypothetical protein
MPLRALGSSAVRTPESHHREAKSAEKDDPKVEEPTGRSEIADGVACLRKPATPTSGGPQAAARINRRVACFEKSGG